MMRTTLEAGFYAVIMGISVWLIVYGYTLWHEARNRIKERMQAVVGEAQPDEISLEKGLSNQLLRLGKKYAYMADRYPQLSEFLLPSDIQQRLAWAGNPTGIHNKEFVGVQLVFTIFMLMIGLYISLIFVFGLSPMSLLFAFVIGYSGAPLAIKWLDSQVAKRQRQITLTLPDVVDLVSTSVMAGLDIDRAIERTVMHTKGPLCDELRRFLNELHLGVPRADAYRNLLWRNRSDELQTIVGALLQGHHLGVPITQTLNEQAEAMRERRLLRAKEEGAKIPSNIIMIMMVFILPSVLVMFATVFGYSAWKDMQPAVGSGLF